MKKFSSAALLMIICFNSVQAQYQRRREVNRKEKESEQRKKQAYSGFYGRIGIGYAFPQAGQTLDGNGYPYSGSVNNNSATSDFTLKNASLASGIQGVIAGGYMFGKHLGIDLSAGIGLRNNRYNFTDNNVNVGSVASDVKITTYAKTPILIMPAVVIQSGGEKVNIYTRIGISLPVNSKLEHDEEFVNLPGTGATDDEIHKYTMKTYFAIGLTGALGVKYKIQDRISIWGEVNALSMSLYAKELDLKEVTVNGQSGYNGSSYISMVPDEYKTTKYAKSLSVDNSNTSTTTNQQPTYSLPFSNIGLQVGISFGL